MVLEGETSTSKGPRNGYVLFREEFAQGKKFKGVVDRTNKAKEAWARLSIKEKKIYSERAKQMRPEKKKSKRVWKMFTRCSVRQFMSLAEFVKSDESLRQRIENIGFSKLLDVEIDKLPRELIVAFIQSYDPATHQFRLRGRTEEVEANDVGTLLGVPHTGEEVKGDVDENHDTYKKLRRKYLNVVYSKILADIKSGTDDEHFELLFMLVTLGTFLAPTSSARVGEKLLRVVCATMNGYEQYDWATYIMNDLYKEMEDYVNLFRKERDPCCTVGGCLYFLVLYLGEKFPLSKATNHDPTNAIAYWTDKRIKELVNKESKSNIGLLYKGKSTKVVEDTISVAHLRPELKQVHRRMMDALEESHKRLSNQFAEELMKVQLHLQGMPSSNLRDLVDNTRDEAVILPSDGKGEEGGSDKGYSDGDTAEGEAHDQERGSDEGDEDGEEGDSEKGDDEGDKGVESSDEETDKGEDQRPSKRTIIPSRQVTSPWISMLKPVKRRKRVITEKDKFFNIVSRMCSREEGQKIMVTMCDEQIDRDQLRTIGGIERVSSPLITMVGRALMAEAGEGGQVRRHIFDAEFMMKMLGNPSQWRASENKRAILPQHIGYNLGDCDLIFGPAIVESHWFCFVLEPKTMHFYVLDSMRLPNDMPKKTKKKDSLEEKRMFHLHACRDNFYDIIALVRPQLVGKKPKTDIIFAPVPQQNNLRDCGVHVLIWLSKWVPDVTFDFNENHVAEFRRELMWWLVNHPQNSSREEALTLLSEQQNKTTTKRRRLS
ncbi:uncharacterized protein LOC114725158 [Neltuma alba]|uniref:uncharacterized protein LOC114725158 n=3 Tax=Neltuma alba TaxID=207710 RepID=UPI0010A37985|nr:uncharacterized protein LOC114725158 [Prosopis alba]